MVSEALGRVINRYEIDSRIVETIAFNPHATIDLVAKETGLSYTAVRNGLQRLVELGVISQTEAIGGPGRRGRPAALFSLERGLRIQIPPRNFDHLADILIEQLIKEDGTEQVQKLLDRAAKQQAKRLIKSWKEARSLPRSIDQMVARICDYINSQGCFAKHFSKNEKFTSKSTTAFILRSQQIILVRFVISIRI